MADSVMVEKVRKAIDGAYIEAMALNLPAEEAEANAARAAIEAMRDRTVDMFDAGMSGLRDAMDDDCFVVNEAEAVTYVWDRMFDAALTQEKTDG